MLKQLFLLLNIVNILYFISEFFIEQHKRLFSKKWKIIIISNFWIVVYTPVSVTHLYIIVYRIIHFECLYPNAKYIIFLCLICFISFLACGNPYPCKACIWQRRSTAAYCGRNQCGGGGVAMAGQHAFFWSPVLRSISLLWWVAHFSSPLFQQRKVRNVR